MQCRLCTTIIKIEFCSFAPYYLKIPMPPATQPLAHSAICGSKCSLSVDEFHRDLESIGDTVIVPGGVNTTVILGIDSVCDPILQKARKRRNKILMYIRVSVLCVCLLALAIWGISSATKNSETSIDDTSDYDYDYDSDSDTDSKTVTYTTEYTATHYADIVIDGYGTITVALDGNQAPITVENFVSLANDGFYDGLTFHRIMDGFIYVLS